MKNMRIQLYATLACFLLTLVTTYGQGISIGGGENPEMKLVEEDILL